MVYELCLVVDYDIAPYPSLFELHRQTLFEPKFTRRMQHLRLWKKPKLELPQTNLLRVSKQIRNETVPILYGKNQWQMPTHWGWGNLNTFDIEETIFVLHKRHFRNIVVCFDWRDVAHTVSQSQILEFGNEHPAGAHLHNVAFSHTFNLSSYVSTLGTTAAQLMKLIPYLDNLVIDIEQLYCPDGCCRGAVMTYFENHFVSQVACQLCLSSGNIKVEIRGLENPEEEELVYVGWGFDADGPVNKDTLKKRWEFELRLFCDEMRRRSGWTI